MGVGFLRVKADCLHLVGDDSMKEYGWQTSRPGKSSVETSAERKLSETLKECFRIYFPARDTVAESKGGLGVSVFGVPGQIKRHALNIHPVWIQLMVPRVRALSASSRSGGAWIPSRSISCAIVGARGRACSCITR